MHFLLCSDGTPEAETAALFAAPLAEAVGARVRLLGVAEREEDRVPLTRAMEGQRDRFEELSGIRPELLVRAGDPTREILARTLLEPYDVVVIGARRTAGTGRFWRSARAYEIVRAVAPPVLVVVGRRERLGRVLICAGDPRYLAPAVGLTTRLALPAGASATLLHVEAQEPTAAGGLPRLPEDARPPAATTAGGDPGAFLRVESEAMVQAGVPAEVRLRRGPVLQEIAGELADGDYDLVVTGMTRARGPVHQYVLGDVTREIINRTGCPVLVVRGNPEAAGRRLFPKVRRSGLAQAVRQWFSPPPASSE